MTQPKLKWFPINPGESYCANAGDVSVSVSRKDNDWQASAVWHGHGTEVPTHRVHVLYERLLMQSPDPVDAMARAELRLRERLMGAFGEIIRPRREQ